VDAGNGMAGLTVPAVPRRRLGGPPACPGCRWRSCRSTSSWTARSRTTRPTRSTRRTWSTCRPPSPAHGADPRPGLRRRRRPVLRRRRARRDRQPERDHCPGSRPGRSPRSGPPAAPPTVIHNLITSRVVPEVIAESGGRGGPDPGRARPSSRSRWPRARRRLRRRALGALLLSATSGSPTPGCSPRCTCSPPWPSRDGPPLGAGRRPTSATPASGEINSTVADVARRHGLPSRAPSPAGPASRSTGWTG